MKSETVASSMDRCPDCGCDELFSRKDFPRKLGLAIVVLAGIAFCILAASRRTFSFAIAVLVGVSALDALLYVLVPRVTVCYRCGREVRGVPNSRHAPFDLAVSEKYSTRDFPPQPTKGADS